MHRHKQRVVMSLENALQFVPTFVLAFFRIAGVTVSAPLFGSPRVPLLKGVLERCDPLPLHPLTINQNRLDLITAPLQSSPHLALQLAAPMLVTMLLTDVVLGFIGKTIPQINVMTLGLPLRSLVGMVVLIFGLMMCSRVIQDSMLDAVKQVANAFSGAMT